MKKMILLASMLTSVFAMAQENVRVHVGEESYVTTIDNITFDVEEEEIPVSVPGLQDNVEKLTSTLNVVGSFVNFKPVEYVDLGLPSGTMWAKTNMGAKEPSQAGLYFRWNNGNGEYQRERPAKGSEMEAILLSDDDDIVTKMCGKGYRIPTKADFEELIANCVSQWVDNYEGSGVDGIIYYKKQDNPEYVYTTDDVHIFLPLTGYRSSLTFNFGQLADESAGHYWTRNFAWDCNNDGYELAYQFYFLYYVTEQSNYYTAITAPAHEFCTIRAVRDPEAE